MLRAFITRQFFSEFEIADWHSLCFGNLDESNCTAIIGNFPEIIPSAARQKKHLPTASVCCNVARQYSLQRNRLPIRDRLPRLEVIQYLTELSVRNHCISDLSRQRSAATVSGTWAQSFGYTISRIYFIDLSVTLCSQLISVNPVSGRVSTSRIPLSHRTLSTCIVTQPLKLNVERRACDVPSKTARECLEFQLHRCATENCFFLRQGQTQIRLSYHTYTSHARERNNYYKITRRAYGP